jgi:hypothetical protein
MKKKNLITAGIIILFLGFGGLPRMLLSPVYQEGVRVVGLIEEYKVQYGAYPDSLTQLKQEMKYDDKGWRGIRYTVLENGREFGLTCYGLWTAREAYSSRTKQWKSLN